MLKGKLFRDSLISAGISIENNRRRVDELNVYPVPDGDFQRIFQRICGT